MSNRITAIRGFNDILPPESRVLSHIEYTAIEVFTSYGFSEMRLPVVEKTELFSRTLGETTDIVEKQMYTFSDLSGTPLTLRPEGTAGVVRAYIEHALYTKAPIHRLFYRGPMFRYERPQKGRYRQFYQVGVEVLGDEGPFVDAELMEMLSVILERVGVKGAVFEINSLGCPGCRQPFRQRLGGFLEELKERLCGDCTRRMERNPLRALDCKNPTCRELTTNAPDIYDYICEGCSAHFDGLRAALDGFGVPHRVNHRMVRGLDYYTRTAFEAVVDSPRLGAQNTIAAGGRYDGLVKELGGPQTPCFGFAIGMERVALLVDRSLIGEEPLFYLIPLGTEPQQRAAGLASAMRMAGMRCMMETKRGASLKSAMKRADRLGAAYVLLLGEDEMKERSLTVRNMTDGTQRRLPLDTFIEELRQGLP